MLQPYTAFIKYNAVELNILPENSLHSIVSGKKVMSLRLKENNYRLLETYMKIKNIFSGFQIFKWILTYLFVKKSLQKFLIKSDNVNTLS